MLSFESSTLQLFGKYIVKNDAGDLDATGVISKECYQEWLSSKSLVPKNPEEAFRKTITAHCRGDNGMHPFTEEQEAAVLAVIRRKMIWPCFENTGIRVGSRGFRNLGYWEKQRKEEVKSSDCTLFIDSERLYGRLRKQDFKLPNFQGANNHNGLTDDEYEKVKEAKVKILESLPTGAFKSGVEAIFSAAKDLTFVLLAQIFRQSGLSVFSPTSLPKIDEMEEDLKHFYSESFAFPDSQERNFSKDRIVGKMICDPATISAYQVDDNCKKIFRGSIVALCTFRLKVNKVQTCIFVPKFLETLKRDDEVWVRTVEFRLDGTIMVLLNHVFKIESEPMGFVIEHQDVTEKYKEKLVAKPELEVQ